MKILVVTRGLPFHQLGGMEAVAWELSRALSKAGADVRILTTACPKLKNGEITDGVELHFVDSKPGAYSRAWWKGSLATFLDKHQNDVDIVLSISAGAMSIARAVHRSATRPVMIAQAHGTSWGEIVSKFSAGGILSPLKSVKNLKGLVADVGYRNFDAIVGVGPVVERDLQRFPTNVVLGQRPVYCIPNGVDADRLRFDAAVRGEVRREIRIAEAERVFLSACRLHPQKGVSTILRSFAAALRQGLSARLLILGDGPERKDLEEQSEQLRVNDRVRFLGHVDASRMPAFLSASDNFIFTTKRVEGLPMNVLEALASGLPVIMSDHLRNPDLPATLVAPQDHDGVTQAILSAQQRDGRSSLLPEKYTLAHAADSYLRLFESLIAK